MTDMVSSIGDREFSDKTEKTKDRLATSHIPRAPNEKAIIKRPGRISSSRILMDP